MASQRKPTPAKTILPPHRQRPRAAYWYATLAIGVYRHLS